MVALITEAMPQPQTERYQTAISLEIKEFENVNICCCYIVHASDENRLFFETYIRNPQEEIISVDYPLENRHLWEFKVLGLTGNAENVDVVFRRSVQLNTLLQQGGLSIKPQGSESPVGVIS